METNCTASISEYGDVIMSVGTQELSAVGTELDMIQLSIFSHRFMSIAEQMGRYVSISTSTFIDVLMV